MSSVTKDAQAKPSGGGGKTTGSRATLAIVLVTSLFFIWGLTMNLVNALNSPFANYMKLDSAQAALLQVAYYGAYFIMAIPAGLIAKRFGYKGGVVSGLFLFALGAFIVIPATNMASYGLFLFAMFVIALGAASLETNCNPYITKLGDEKGESFRINMAQSFNGVGNIVGPLILGQILGATIAPGKPGFEEAKTQFLANTRTIYIVIGVVLVVVLAIFAFFKLPLPATPRRRPRDRRAAKRSPRCSSGRTSRSASSRSSSSSACRSRAWPSSPPTRSSIGAPASPRALRPRCCRSSRCCSPSDGS